MAIKVEEYINHHYPSVEKFPDITKKILFSFLKNIFHEDEINQFLEKNKFKDPFTFIEAVLDYFGVKIVINKKELRRIPSYGRVVIIANHPLGALDALALIYILQDVRKDIKVLGNSFLNLFKNLEPLLVPVDNIQGKIDKSSLQAIYESLNREEAVIIFPSGEVSRARPRGVEDTRWKSGFLKIATKSQAPILPIYIKAKNSKGFYLLSMLNKSLATATLPNEMFKYKEKSIGFTIGQSVPYESYAIASLDNKERLKLLRKHFYRVARNRKPILKTSNEIALAEPKTEIKEELKNAIRLGKTADNKLILQYKCAYESVVIKEIGRLREISFRQVGEGSGKKRDIDKYDLYYEHLIIWDEDKLEIAGAYRIGICADIIKDFGVEGLYTSTLFSYESAFYLYFEHAVELGRSFVQPKYWNTRALDYLWYGIGAFIKNNPDTRYLFGGVSISVQFTKEAKEMIIFFYNHYFGDKTFGVAHKESYKLSAETIKRANEIFQKDNYRKDITTLRNELNMLGFSIPTLYKQYSETFESDGVKFLDFGIDADFNDCVDGFIFTDLTKLKPNKKKRYLGE